jgi:DNA repair exonuclease SbcCD nuclease subunit
MAWRFVQLSDVHLGNKLPGLEQWLANTLRVASREAVARCFLAAAEQHCRAVLIPGDLFDLKGVDPEGCLGFVYQQAARYPHLQFIIAPGNADAYGPSTPYTSQRPPENVTVFTQPDWQALEVDGVQIVGRAIHAGEGMTALDRDSVPRPDPDKLSILLLHASLEGGEDGRQIAGKNGGGKGRLQIMPLTIEDLQRLGYSYVALGHYHAKLEIQNRGLTQAAYSGPPQCLDWDERGPGGYLIGDLEEGGAKVDFVPSARHAWKQRRIELPPPYAESYRAKLTEALAQITVDIDPGDLLSVSVSGTLHESAKPVLERALDSASGKVLYCAEPDISGLQWFSGVDPVNLPKDSLLTAYFSRCAAEMAQKNIDPDIYDITRRIGWQLFTGQGLPAELTE